MFCGYAVDTSIDSIKAAIYACKVSGQYTLVFEYLHHALPRSPILVFTCKTAVNEYLSNYVVKGNDSGTLYNLLVSHNVISGKRGI